MKAFSFLTILESLSKKLSILRTKMHSDDLRVDYESITSQLRVSRPFSRTSFADLSRRTSFDLSRRVSHFAAILTILFTIGVGSVSAQETVELKSLPTGIMSFGNYAWGDDKVKNKAIYSEDKYFMMWSNGNHLTIDGTGFKIGNSSKKSAFVFRVASESNISVNVARNGSDADVYLYYLGSESTVGVLTDPHQYDTNGGDTKYAEVALNSSQTASTLTKENAPAGYYMVLSTVRFYATSIEITTPSGGGETPNPGNPMDNLVLISSDYTFTPTAALTANTLYEENRFISLGDGNGFNNGIQLKTNRQLAFKVAAGAQIKVTFRAKDDRKLQIGTTSAGTDLANSATSPVTATQTTGGIVYLSASSDLYASEIEITFPQSPPSTTYTVSFDTHGGGNVDAISQSSAGAAITLPAAPTKTGYTFAGWYTAATGGTKAGDAGASYTPTATITLHAQWTENPPVTPEPEQVPQVGTFTGMGMSGMVNLYWTMPTKPVTTRVDIASATLSAAVGQSDGATSTITKVNTNEIKVEYSTDEGWLATGVKIPLATPQTNVESITFEYKSASDQKVDLIPFLYDGTTRWVESDFTKLTPTEWTSHTSVITQEVWNNSNIYSKDKTIQSVNFYANPATATSGTFYIRNVVLNQGTQVAASGLIIVRKVGSNPTSPTDGTPVYNGDGIAATCTDNNELVDGTTYHYAAFAHDGQGNYSEPLYWQYTYTEGLNTYAPDDTDFPNPERGFYEQVQWNANKGYNAVIGDSYFNAARAASRSLILRIYYMDSETLRTNQPLPNDFITMFNADMAKFRTNGMKCILRFAYDENSGDGFQDASPATWATHLAQLKPYLQANADVIYVVQAGFLGVWGEWYYSSLGRGDDIDLAVKNNLIGQLLEAVPANRCVQLRTPLFKKQYLDHNNALTSAAAYKGTAQARLGHHNDAFLNGEQNQGTYENRTTDMEYIAQECLYVPIGGETNLDDGELSTYDAWCKGSIAEAEMAQLHYSYLNHSYSQYVTNQWKTEGSYARMSKLLGYRFELTDATLPNEATAGTQMNVQLNIKNVGYAPLYNERHAYIVFKNNTNTYSIQLESDPRTWAPNNATIAIDEYITLPATMAAGTYDLYLYLPDASASIAADPKYAVRFANQGIWESETGYNKLNKQVEVTATELDTYTITYNLNGGTGDPEPTEQTAVEGQSVTLATATGLSKAGHTFAGWSDGTNTYEAGTTYTMPASDVELTAQWTPIEYTITYNGLEGATHSNPATYTIESETITFANPTSNRTGYTFAGWNPASIQTGSTGNKTVTATWTANTYTVTLNTNDGTINAGNVTSYTYGVGATLPANVTKSGYTFAGWFDNDGLTGTAVTTIPADATGNKTYWAKWTINSYTLTWDVNGGNTLTGTYTSGNVNYGAAITKPADPTRTGYTFAGWHNGTSIVTPAATMPANNVTYTAQWTANQYNITYKDQGNADFSGTHGANYPTKHTYGTATTLVEPTKANYEFGGWYTNSECTGSAVTSLGAAAYTAAITLYAKWTAAKTNPTTTWDVAETAYAGQLVSVSVNTTSDATLTTSSLTTNKGTLQDVTVNGKTITATLQVPDNASGTITLTLTTDATENYNASTSTKTITLSECPTTGSGGEETVTLSATDNQASGYFFVGDGSIITNILGNGAKEVSFSENKSKITVNTSKPEATITFTIGTGIIVTGFEVAGSKNSNTKYYLDGSEITIGDEVSGLNKTSSLVFKLQCTDQSGSSNRNTYITSFKFTYTSSGSGGSALETNLAWSGDLSSGVSKQVGDANFTYTASSNNSAGAITYSSSVTSVATINQTTGEVTIVGAGTTTITATIDAIGCYPEKSITYTLAVTSTGTPEPTTYTVTYNLGGGTGTLPTQAATTAGSTFTLASADGITKDGYDFAGWSDGTNTYAAGATYTMPASNVTLTAQWTPEKYNINYYEAVGEVNDISGLNQISIVGAPTSYTILDAITLPELPDKDGYTATGWYTIWCVFQDGGTGKGWAGCETTTGHLAGYYGHANYIVKYTPDVPAGTLYTVTVNSATNGTVTANKTTNVAQGETVTLTVTPAIGYELGTLTVKDASDNNVTVTDNTFTMPASNVTVSATFTAIETPEPGECANLITYDLSKQNPTVEDTETEVATTDKNGSGIYKLNGISGVAVHESGYKLVTAGDYIGVKLSSGNFQVGDKVTIYVTQVSGTQGHTYLKIFNRKNPSSDTHVLGTIETPVVGENIFTLTSETEYIYVARTSMFDQNPFIKSISVCRPTTPDPDPEPGSYTLTYNENQPAVWVDVFASKNIPDAQTLTGGTGTVSANTPEPVITENVDSDYAIYTLAGWNTAADGTGKSYAAGEEITITENTTLYAQWTPQTFKVTYFDEDRKTPLEGMVNTTYTFGVGIPNLPTPTKPGHTFTGWIPFWDAGEGPLKEIIEPTDWGDAQLAAQWDENCTMPTTTFANGKYVIGSEPLDLETTLIADNNNIEGAITYAVTGGVAATINGSLFTCDRIGVVTVTATQAASGGYCEKIMTATINVAMPVTDGCAQMFTFEANDAITNPSGQKGKNYLDLSSYATINGLSTTGKVGIKDMETSDDDNTTLIQNKEIYFPNTNTYLKVENLSTPLVAGDKISIGTQQSATTEYIITISGTQCTSNCITTTNQQYTIPAESSLIGVTTFYIWSANAEKYLNTINICRPAYTITYKANNGKEEDDKVLNDAVLVAGCPNTFTVPAGKQFAGWNTAADGTGTSYSVGTIIPENNLILYAQWECIKPVFTVSCDKTAYAKDEANAEPITVSVTAGNSGGVTYQWFASDKNDRTTGTAITGEIAASYTPSTATAGTTYYWCEISNSCTTVKTPTIAITVTVTKNNANVEWTNPPAVNYGGGGYTISATVNNEWNGTLLPSMLTAPTGIKVYDIEINGKTITAKFDVTTTFDRTIENQQSSIPFVLTLPETTTYNPLVSEKKVSYDACANGGGTEYRIPVKAKSDQQEINPYNRWDTENIGWITWDQGGGTISSESATYNDFSYRTKSGKQVILIYSKIQEVKAIRIYGYGSNATECTAVSVGKEYNKYTKLSKSEYVFKGNTINNRENGVIEISFTTPLKEGTYVQFNFSKNALFYGVELETEGGEKIETTLSFATAGSITKTQNDANFTNKATPSNNTLGTITYSSSNTDVATVNSTTGEVSIITAGTTIITATLAPSGCYQGVTATYELTVTEQTCNIAAGTLSASKTDKYDCEEVTLTLSNYEQGATIQWWHNGEAINSKPGIAISNNTLTTTLEGTYSALVTKGCSIRSNSVTITNIAFASATPLVNEWYIKNGRLTPPIALWKLEGGARIAGVGWMKGEEVSTAPYDNPENVIDVENGIVYLTGTPPQANETGEDIRYTIQLNIYNSCDDSPMVVPSTITIVHQKNTDKHVLAFVVTGTVNGGFTKGITTAQTTNVPLYNKISQEFDVLATNIYATDNEQLLKEYYSRFDIICITDYPNSKETGVNGKSYTDAMGALIDIRPILSMEAWVSKYSNWNDKGVTGDPKSPTTRQYSMLLQCKDHEIFAGTNLIQEGSGDELMYRVTMVDATKEDYVTLDKVEENPHQEKEGYKYGSNPALQGFTYTSAMSSMLPIGTIDDGDGNNLQVGIERQYEIEARMIVLGVNSYAMERLTDDGERVIINTLKYLMKKQSSEIADCSIYFDNNNGNGDNQWNNPENWAPSRNSLPQASQEARILAPCIVSGIVAKVASIKIVPDGKYAPAYGGIDAKGSLTIAPDGALVVGGHIQAATAPNYYEARPTTPENLIVQADETGSGALIHGEENGELGATVELVSKAYSVKEFTEGKYKKKKYWQYVALPVREALAEDAFWGAYTYQYDETKGWIKKGTGERIEEFWGVGLSIDNEVYSGANNEQALTKFTIKGNLALAIDRDIDLTKTPDAGEGQNMIGNSWTAPIHLTSMTADDFENATATVYIYNTGRDELVSGSEGTASSANGSTQAGQWISIPVAATALDPWQGPKVIPAMQAFEVDLAEGESGGILHLNYDKHVRTIATPEEENLPLRAPKYPSDRPSMIRLRVADSTTYTDLYLIEGDQFTDEFDNAWDGKYQPCDGRSATLYAMSPIGDMAVLAQPSVNNTSVVFEPGKKTEYVFTFGYNGNVTYYLNDMQLKTSTEIKEGNEYRFTYNKGDMKNRFLVTRESFDSPNISTGLANIVTDGNGLQVTNPNQENLQVILIDAAGRLCSIYNTAEPMFNIELPATQGVYMINVKGETTNIVRKVVK